MKSLRGFMTSAALLLYLGLSTGCAKTTLSNKNSARNDGLGDLVRVGLDGCSRGLEGILSFKPVQDYQGFNLRETSRLIRSHVPPSYANSLSEKYDVTRIIRYFKLGLTENMGEFDETSTKKKVVLAISLDDHNGALNNKYARAVYKHIIETYNTRVIFVKREDEIYDAVRAVPGLGGLFIAGHGRRDRVCLKKGIGEKGYLSLKDLEMAEVFENVAEDFFSCLVSCSTGSGGSNELNFANYLYYVTGGKTVISASKKLYMNQVLFSTEGLPDFIQPPPKILGFNTGLAPSSYRYIPCKENMSAEVQCRLGFKLLDHLTREETRSLVGR